MDDISILQTEIDMSKGKGNIIICMTDTHLLEDRIIETLGKKFRLKKIYVKDGEHIIRTLKKEKGKSHGTGYDVLIWIMPEKETTSILNALNSYRELFYDISIPNLIFCNRGFLETLIRETPDFWRYRGNYYEFETEEELPPIVRSIFQFPFLYRDKDDLLRRKRIIEYLLDKTDDDGKGYLYSELTTIYQFLGELDKALECSQEALIRDRVSGNMIAEANDLVNIGILYQYQRKIDESLNYFEKALEIHRKIGFRNGEAIALRNIGLIYRIKGNLDLTFKYLQEALEINRETGYRQGESIDLGNIGLVHIDKGNLDEALKYCEKALEIDREIGNRQGEAFELGYIGVIYSRRGNLNEALRYFQEALEISREIGYKLGESDQLRNIGKIYIDKGNLDEALEYLRAALEIDREIGQRQGEAFELANIGIILKTMGKKEESLDYLREALSIFVSSGAKTQADTIGHHIQEVTSDN